MSRIEAGVANVALCVWMSLECSMQNRQQPIANRKLTRRGLTALLAMLYLTLIASLAVGFYASTNSAAMVTENEKRSGMALACCESGMDFMNFQMAQLAIPYGTPPSQLLDVV